MTTLIARWGYVGVFIAILAEEAGVPLPVPGDVFIAALGAAGRAHQSSFVVTALIVLVASLSGSAVLYHVSYRVGQPMLFKIGRRFGFDADRAARVERWLARRGVLTIVVGRLIPGLRIVVTVAAGGLRMRLPVFLLGTGIASLLWASIYYWAGFALGAGVSTALQSAFGRTLRDPDALAVIVAFVALAVAAAIGRAVFRN